MSEHHPAGWHTVTPRIFTADVPGLVGFLRSVFDAAGELHEDRPSEMTIGDSIVMVSGGRDPMAACLYVYVADADDVFGRAVAAGAETVESPVDMPYGDRRATVRDAWGNLWQIASRR